MNKSGLITKLYRSSLAVLAAGVAQQAGAFTYSDSDLLLVFRKDGNFNDVEFNLGSVTNYLNKPAGTKVPVSNWDVNVVKANYNNSLGNVKFLLASASAVTDSPRKLWVTSADLAPATAVTDMAGSRFGALASKVSLVGNYASAGTATNATQNYAISQSDATSYTYIVSGGGAVDPTTVGGLAPFQVENVNPTTLVLYEVKISNLNPKPAATLVGSFCLNPNGDLTFTAGPLAELQQPNIVSLGRSGGTSSISFSTQDCVNYRLRYSTDVASPMAPLSTVIGGDGGSKVLTDTAADQVRFYQVEAFR
ncbi:MAG: hypothetical protein JWM16_5906 [Verrucomicrobiales bacterium]|nr:hypothetical protein [Verrucomicrobiales bacterium]